MVALKKAAAREEAVEKHAKEKSAKAQGEISILIQAGQGEGMAGEGEYLQRDSPEANSLQAESPR